TTSIGFDMSKVECYNCHKRGHFARECSVMVLVAMIEVFRQMKNQQIMPSWHLPLQVSSSSGSDSKAEKERDELKHTLETFQTSLKNLSKLLASHITDKTRLGYDNQVFNSTVFDCDELISYESDVSVPISLVNDMYKSGEGTFVKPVEHPTSAENLRKDIPKSSCHRHSWNRKACFVCKSLNHLIKDCDYYEKKMVQKHVRNHAMRGHHQHYARMTHSHPHMHVVSTAVLTRSRLVPLTAARPVTTVGNPRHALKDKGVIDSGCSRHMTGNISYLSDFEEINGGYVAFGGNPKGGKITGKGKIRIGKLDFDDVYFVKELKFNLFSVSQMYDKKNIVLFTDTEGIVLSFDFKLSDENHVLLRVPRENNMYNVDLKNIVHSGDLTCLFAKATLDESNLWHRRLGHINFKTMNKLVKGNLVRGLPSKDFENNYTCVACKNGKQHRASWSGPTWLFDIDTLTQFMNYQPVAAGNQPNHNACIQENLNADPQNTYTDVAFDVKEPESEVHVSPSSSDKTKKYDKKTKREAKGKSLVDLSTGVRNLSTNSFNVAGPSNNVVSLTFKIEDITYLDDEEDVGADADFSNLETSITVSPIPTTRVHKDHPITQIIGDLSSTPQTRSMTRMVKDQGFKDPDYPDKVYKVVKALYGLHQAPRACQDKYVADILRKFGLTDGKSANTPIDTNKPLLKDPDGDDVDVHTYSDYAGASLDRKSTTGGCQFLGCRLISWQCKKQTVVATSSTEAEYVAVASCCAQVLWIQNQLLNYGQLINAVSSKLMLFGLTIDAAHLMLLVRLQALIDRKKVIITEDTIRQALRLDDADGVDCLPNEEIFAELARMLVRNVDSPSKFLMYLRFLQLMINAQVDDLSSHNTKYTSPALRKKVFANMRRIGNGFSGVYTLLFDGMLVQQQVEDVEDATENENDDNDVSAEPTPHSPTPVTPPPSPIQEHIPSPSQAESTCATLTKQVANLEQDTVAQAIEITKLKKRVRKLEKKRQFKTSGLKRLRKGRIVELDADEDVTLEDVDAEVAMDADVPGRLAESQAKVYHLDLQHAEKVLSMQDTDEVGHAEVEEVIKVVTAAKLMTEVVTTAATTITVAQVPKASAPKRKKGVVIQDPKETVTASVIVHSEVKSKDKGKGILIKEPKPLKRQAQIKQDEAFAR
nr:ribonuclease H-like domain-containing protein [Tanacetum cinerariifolium]